MVIGIDASRANRDHKSGTEWYSYYLIRWLAKLDKKNQYILYTDKPLKVGLLDLTAVASVSEPSHPLELNKDSDEQERKSFKMSRKKNEQVIKSPYNNFKAKVLKWPFGFFWTQGRLSLEMLFNKVDVLFVPAHALPIIHPKKSIVTLHDIGFARDSRLYGRDQMGPKSKRRRTIINYMVKIFTLGKYGANSMDYYIWSTKYALKHALKILTVSYFSKKELIGVYGDEENKEELENKIKVVYNGYSKHLYVKIDDKEAIKMVLEKYGIKEPYLLYIGRLEKKKNISALIEAYAIIRERNKDIKHKLVLVGDASFGYDEINYQIREFGLDDNVIMPGWVLERDMPYIYNGASVFVFPSLYEGFGIPILQAMASEAPVVASQTTSIPEVAGEAAMLFNPHRVISIADTLEIIITNRELREELIKRGKERVKKFGWKKCAKETLREIERM